DGMVIPSTEPGLGVVLDVDVARAHPYEGNELHLTPENDPIPVREDL
ncbi:MAG: mandelate racemase/muconate lactonizing enzyme family protein, partial [Actinomycetota bacterium]|nr:mandelate racemase/muconate lactonizing enzyme family protein [Actinomycetota bacterium]